MYTPRIILVTILIFGCLVLPEMANAQGIKLASIVQLISVNNFNKSDPKNGGCEPAYGSAIPIPKGKAFAIYDIRCTVGYDGAPPEQEEAFFVRLVDGAGCSGGSVYSATFSSVDGLRDSPTLPRVVEHQLTVAVKRAQSLNPSINGWIQVVCEFTGTFEKVP